MMQPKYSQCFLILSVLLLMMTNASASTITCSNSSLVLREWTYSGGPAPVTGMVVWKQSLIIDENLVQKVQRKQGDHVTTPVNPPFEVTIHHGTETVVYAHGSGSQYEKAFYVDLTVTKINSSKAEPPMKVFCYSFSDLLP